MIKRSYLFTRVPSSLMYMLPMREFIMLTVLMEREGYLNRSEIGEWFAVPNIYLCKALDVKNTSGSVKNLITQLREELREKGLIEYEIGDVKNACKYRIIWENVVKIAKFSSDFWINNDAKTFQNWKENSEKTFQNWRENDEKTFQNRYHKTNITIKEKPITNNQKQTVEEDEDNLPF